MKVGTLIGLTLVQTILGSQYPPDVDHDFPCGRPTDDSRNFVNDHQIETLISKMDLSEKLGQLTQINIGNLINKETQELDPSLLKYYVIDKKVGSFLNNLVDGQNIPPASPEKWVRIINQIQDTYQNGTRLKIPTVYGLDSVHGAHYIYRSTILPQQLGLAATFNRELTRKSAAITAKDTRAVGVHWNFSPILDIAVNKQWPRVYETFGEDPYLTAELGKEMIIGYQGCNKDLARGDKVAACMKHFIGYSATRSGKDVDGSWMSERVVNDYFRPSFQAAVNADVATAMEAYSDIEGDHIVNSKQYLVDMLRHKMQFKGTLVTDWEQINKLYEPIHIATSQEDAVYRVMKLGSLDMSMVPNNADFITHLENLIRKGKINIDIINTNVRRILVLKKKLGLLEQTGHVDPNSKLVQSIGSKEDKLVSLQAAQESITLLQNKNNILPLSKDKKILLTGPTANSLAFQTGGWTFAWQGVQTDEWFQNNGTTILQGLKSYAPNSVTHIPVIDIWGNPINNSTSVDTVIAAASTHDVVVVCLGEHAYAELMGNINNMELPKGQLDLLDALLKKSSKPVVLILNQGRPRVVTQNVKDSSAILNNFLAGPQSGQAIADIIYGTVNPSGKLPLTYANHVNDNTVNYYRRFNEDNGTPPAFEFGYGLSYTTFKYSNLQLSQSTMSPEQHIIVSVDVNNAGAYKGKEVVLMFVTDLFRSLAPEVKKLKGFEKIELSPGESKNVKFVIKVDDLKFANFDNKYVAEAGKFVIAIADLKQEFEFTVAGNDIHYLGD